MSLFMSAVVACCCARMLLLIGGQHILSLSLSPGLRVLWCFVLVYFLCRCLEIIDVHISTPPQLQATMHFLFFLALMIYI